MSTENKPIDIIVSHLPRTHQVKVSWRPDLGMTVSPTGLEGARWLHDNMGWTLPALGAHQLLPYFRDNFPKNRVSFDKGSAALIYEQLEREAATSTLALAEDGDVPDVLSVPSKPFQRAAVAYALRDKSRKLIALPTGCGKTFVAASIARIRQSRTLWVTLSALQSNLQREIAKLTGQRAIRLIGTTPSTESIRLLQDTSYQHIIISYDTLARSIMKDDGGHVVGSLWCMLINASHFDLLVCDEIHKARNRNTNAFKALNLIKDVPSMVALTATPIVNNGLDMFSIMHLLDGKTFESPAEFTRAYLSADGKRIVSPRKMQQDLLPYVFRRKKEDILKDLPPKIRQHHNITLSEEWREKYNNILRGIYEDLKGHSYDVPDSVLAQMNRFRQLAENAKVEHTVELARELEESGEKSIIFTCFRESGEALSKELYCDFVHGDIPEDERLKLIDKFQNDPTRKHLVMMMQVGGTGFNITAASAILFNGFFWHDAAHTQAEDRAYGRLNDVHGVLVYYVQVENSIDSFMLELIHNKQELSTHGVDGVKVYATEQVSLKNEFVRRLRESGPM